MSSKQQSSVPVFNVGQVLTMRKRVREGDLRNRTLRSVAYVQKSSEREVAQALSGEGRYQNYAYEGIISRDTYMPFFEGHMTFAQASELARQQARDALAEARDHVPTAPKPNGNGLAYNVDKHLVVSDVTPTAAPVPARQPGTSKPIPWTQSLVDNIRLAYATRPDLNMGELVHRHGMSTASLKAAVSGDIPGMNTKPYLPYRSRNFKYNPAPKDIAQFIEWYKPGGRYADEAQYAQQASLYPATIGATTAPEGRGSMPVTTTTTDTPAEAQGPVQEQPEPASVAQAIPTQTEALVRSLVEQAAPLLGWVRMRDGSDLADILDELQAAHEMQAEALGRLREWERTTRAGGEPK